jgi:hypothetical protein
MVSLLRFNDLETLNVHASGVGGAGLAVASRAGLPAVRGFVVPPQFLSDFLKKDGLATVVADSRAGGMEKNTEGVKAAFHGTRIQWGQEMDLVSGFRELASTVSLVTSTPLGTDAKALYASTEEEFLDCLKDCWLRWILSDFSNPKGSDLPAVLIREIPESDLSVEIRKKREGIHGKAVFGLPEGLADSSVSSDIFELNGEGNVIRMEKRTQEWQYLLGKFGPRRVPLATAFQKDEKLPKESVALLSPFIDTLQKAKKMSSFVLCFVGDGPMIYSSDLAPETGEVESSLPRRADSLRLTPKPELGFTLPADINAPIIATRLFVKLHDEKAFGSLREAYVEGMVITQDFIEKHKDWQKRAVSLSLDFNRRLRTATVVVETNQSKISELETFSKLSKQLSDSGINLVILLPGCRSSEDLARLSENIAEAMHDVPFKLWASMKYPSNMFFMDALAARSDVLALDLNSLGRLMMGITSGQDEGWLNYSLPVLHSALSSILKNALEFKKQVAVLSPKLVSAPSLLEYLVREQASILCVEPDELQTVRHIVASIEKRMLIERGMGR